MPKRPSKKDLQYDPTLARQRGDDEVKFNEKYGLPEGGPPNKKVKDANQKRALDAKVTIVPSVVTGEANNTLSLDILKTVFLGDGLSEEQISERFFIPVALVHSLIVKHKLVQLRNAYIKAGVMNIQNKQIGQAHEILGLEAKFKQVKLEQLKVRYDDYMAYYARHGDFYKRQKSGKIMLDNNQIPVMVAMPNAVKELKDIRDSLVMGAGIQRILDQLNAVLNNEDTSGEDFEIEDLFG